MAARWTGDYVTKLVSLQPLSQGSLSCFFLQPRCWSACQKKRSPFAEFWLQFVLLLFPFFVTFALLLLFFLTLTMEVKPYHFEPPVSKDKSSASDDLTNRFLDDVNEDRDCDVESTAFHSFPLLLFSGNLQ